MTFSHSSRHRLWVACAVLVLGLPGASGTPVYQVGAITAPDAVGITPYAINSGGSIAGAVTTVAGALNATFWRGDASLNLNRPGLAGSIGYAINNSGQVAGGMFTPEGDFRPCVWTRDRVVQLMPRTGIAMGIAGSGDTVGWAIGDGGYQQAFIYRQGSAHWLTDAPSQALSVNGRGQVVGYALGDEGSRAFLWEQTRGRPYVTIGRFVTNAAGNTLNRAGSIASMAGSTSRWTDLGTLGGANSQALAINNDGIVVGWSSDSQGETRAFLYRDGAIGALPDLGGAFSRANAIDDTGIIVGAAGASDGISHAVLWGNGRVLDLNTLIPADSGWVLHGAIALNGSGRIIGYGAYRGEPRAFVLTPR